jgi:CBS domain-containing protein
MSDYELFQSTIKGLDQTFTVGLIATFDLFRISVADDPQKWFDNNPDFDQCPVIDEHKTVGILDREFYNSASMNWYSPLTDQILISNDTPLSTFIPLMLEKPYYRFILKNSKVAGIVTRSDLLKLPIKLYAFAHITHLEMLMSKIIIEHTIDDDQVLERLKNHNRRTKVNNRFRKHKRGNTNPPIIEFTELFDKAFIINQIVTLDNNFIPDIEIIYELRNKVAHAGDYAENSEKLVDFITTFNLVQYWITQLSDNNY